MILQKILLKKKKVLVGDPPNNVGTFPVIIHSTPLTNPIDHTRPANGHNSKKGKSSSNKRSILSRISN